jgi:hypothetical protein
MSMKVAQALAHLLAFADPKTVRIHLPRQFPLQGDQHRRPNNRVKPQDVFRDQVYVRRPELPTLIRVDRRNVIEQRIDPHINRMLRVARHANAPVTGPCAKSVRH